MLVLLMLIIGYALYKALHLLVIILQRFGIGIMPKLLASGGIIA